MILYKSLFYVDKANGPTKYFVWWALSDKVPWFMKDCENMVKIICKTSKLKCNDFNLKTFAQKVCVMCDLAAYENIEHVTLSCTFFSELRRKTFEDLKKIPNGCPL